MLLNITYINDNQNGFPTNCRTADHAYLDLNLLLIKKKYKKSLCRCLLCHVTKQLDQ